MKGAFVALLAGCVAAQDDVLGLNSGVGRGYDIVTEEIRAPLYTWHYDMEQTWLNPYNGKVERIPDELFLTNHPDSQETKAYSVQNSWETYEHTRASNFGLDVSYGIEGVDLGASFQKSKKEADGYLRNGTAQFSYTEHVIGYYKLEAWYGIMDFAPQFDMLVSKLPTQLETEDDANEYKKFYDIYGTHVVVSGLMGGLVNFTTSFDTELLSTHDEKWVSTQLGLSITWNEINAGLNSSREDNTEKADEDFGEHSRNTHFAVGGDPNVMQLEGFEPWLQTLTANPALVMQRSKLVPLHQSITDSTKRSLALKALANYVNTGGARCL